MTRYTINVSEACYDEIRAKLVELGNGGIIIERPHWKTIDMTGVTIKLEKPLTPPTPTVG